MPIRRQHRWLYPIDWPQLSAAVRFRRAKGRCEGCGRPHGRVVLYLGDGRWWDDRGLDREACIETIQRTLHDWKHGSIESRPHEG